MQIRNDRNEPTQPAPEFNDDGIRPPPGGARIAASPPGSPAPGPDTSAGTANAKPPPAPVARGQSHRDTRAAARPSASAPSSVPDAGTLQTYTIYGTNAASPPNANLPMQERENDVDAYTSRVSAALANIESGSEAERNVKFQNVRPFMTPSGYFSGGLMAAGYDPNQPISVRFDSYVGMGRPESPSGSEVRTYPAWEVAAGALKHDAPEPGGVVNFRNMVVSPADQATVKDLESLGARLDPHWSLDVAAPLADGSGALAERSGKADAYGVRATLESLRADKAAFPKLSPEGQQALNRTLDQSGQVIVPNVYGYPLEGHAFIPYQPYDRNEAHRPNQGLMVDLDQGTVSEIHGDKDFAKWAGHHRDRLMESFNARDMQGGLDAHWPRASDVIDNLIAGRDVTYPGYQSALSDRRVPVGELFNYTEARGGDYHLKFGNLTRDGTGVAAHYQAVNANNAAWADQSQVFGASAQSWKQAEGIWDRTFGFLPIVGSLGKIVFGVHNGLDGMTAQDRVAGNVGATLSGLQLMHEVAPAAAGLAAGKLPAAAPGAAGTAGTWKYDPPTSEFRFTPPQRVNGKIGYPMSPSTPPRLDGTDQLVPAGKSAGGAPSAEQAVPEPPPAGADAPQGDAEPAAGPSARHPDPAPAPEADPAQAGTARERSSSMDSTSSTGSMATAPSRGQSAAPSRRTSVAAAPPPKPDVPSPPAANDDGFQRLFPGGLGEAESYLKDKALAFNRSPAYLASDRYAAPESWRGLSPETRNELMDRYLSVWDPPPRRADFGTDEAFQQASQAYTAKIGKYREGGNFNIEKYWNDLVSSQNEAFRTFVDNQTKRLAVATKAYDNHLANPGDRPTPGDPGTLRQQMLQQQFKKRDVTFLQREALNFGKNSLFRLDDRNMSELRSSFLSLFGRDNQQIEAAFAARKADLENELYQFAHTDVTRDMVDAKKKALQDRFNSDVDLASKNMDFMYKRIALYGTVGTLSLSALSAILWKTIDEIRQKS